MKNFRILFFSFLIVPTVLFYGCEITETPENAETEATELSNKVVEEVVENLAKEADTLLKEEADLDTKLDELESLDL